MTRKPEPEDAPTEAVEPQPEPVDDAAIIAPPPSTVTLKSGTRVNLVPLGTRQFMALLRIITHGAGPTLLHFDLDPDEPEEAFRTKLTMMLLLAVPDAEDETIAFIRTMCEPAGLYEARLKTKGDREHNAVLVEDLHAQLHNPCLDDLLTIVEAVVRREAPELRQLGKRLAQMFTMARKAGLIPDSPTSPAVTSLAAGSPTPSI